jgi:hypothetical protein
LLPKSITEESQHLELWRISGPVAVEELQESLEAAGGTQAVQRCQQSINQTLFLSFFYCIANSVAEPANFCWSRAEIFGLASAPGV